MHFAREAGVDIDMESYYLGVQHFGKDKAETGFLIYGSGGCERPIPVAFNTDTMDAGKMTSYNGGLSAAGILMRFAENHRAAHMSSLISAFAWNNTFGGHGGNFWNNFWTPLGAHQHSKQAFINFWKNHRWYRECHRMYDGSLIQHESGKVGAACGVALVAPRRRIQVVGAPMSPFSAKAPTTLKPAVELYWKKDYAGCEKMIGELVATGTVGKDDMPTVSYLLQQARDIQASIEADLSRMKQLAAAGDPAQAKSFLAGLKGIAPEGDQRIADIEKMLASAKQAPKVEVAAKADEKVVPPRKWQCLVSERITPGAKRKKSDPNLALRPEANMWKISVVEDMAQAPKGWTESKFDDSAWMETALPISWRMYHTALLRTRFNVADKKAFDGLRLRAWVFRQQGIEIYLNGEIIGKINNIEKKTGDISNEFKDSAFKHLKNGENTLAITTRHNWRWGMLFMKVYNDGFDFNLDARIKE